MITKFLNLFKSKRKLVVKTYLFVEVYREYVDKYLKENEIEEGTANRYENYWRNFTAFMAANHLYHLPLSEVRIKHAEQFRAWLRVNYMISSVRHCSRQVEMWKRVTKYALMMEYCPQDHLFPIKAQRDRPNKVIALTSQELKRLWVYQFHSDMMRMVADLFLFQCFTGLGYSDLYLFKIAQKGDKQWIVGKRKKSDEPYRVPFFDEAKEIYLKYQGHLPKLSNQKYNEYLKEVAHILKIDKRLTTHVGRKTAATMFTERGVTAKAGSMMLGNTPKVYDESYVDNTDAIIENELARVGVTTSLFN